MHLDGRAYLVGDVIDHRVQEVARGTQTGDINYQVRRDAFRRAVIVLPTTTSTVNSTTRFTPV